MNKKYALVIALLITLLFISNYYLYNLANRSSDRTPYIVARVIDGDTLELNDSARIRLVNVNSPEKRNLGSELSFEYLKTLENNQVYIEDLGEDRYQRKLARVYTDRYVNLELVRQGYSSKFLVQDMELKEFSKAEKDAVQNGMGIWKPSPLYGCISSSVNSQAEVIYLEMNNCPFKEITLIIKDESTKEFMLKNLSFDELQIHSGKGFSTGEKIYLNSSGNIWNNDRDTLYIFDHNRDLVEYYPYGY